MSADDERGFTLLEVLVALVILIMGLAAVYQAFGSGLLAGAAAERDRRAAEAAENLFAGLGRSRAVSEGVTTGELPDGQRWTLRLDPFDPVKSDGPPSAVAAHIVTLEVVPAGGRGNPARFQTLIIGVRPR